MPHTLVFRRARERGHTQWDWLDSWHTFSFGEYYDPTNKGFAKLRVINDDVVSPGGGFAPHGHQDMEILTYVLSGTLAHQDSLGNKTFIPAGDLQIMSAGTGIQHSEMNASDTEPVHFLQIWIFPERKGLVPSYEQKSMLALAQNQWTLVASPQAQEGAMTLHQDTQVYLAPLDIEQSLSYTIQSGRCVWLHLVRGAVRLDGTPLTAGDGVGMDCAESFTLVGEASSEVLVFDMPVEGIG